MFPKVGLLEEIRGVRKKGMIGVNNAEIYHIIV
jgi:hypothetical protein